MVVGADKIRIYVVDNDTLEIKEYNIKPDTKIKEMIDRYDEYLSMPKHATGLIENPTYKPIILEEEDVKKAKQEYKKVGLDKILMYGAPRNSALGRILESAASAEKISLFPNTTISQCSMKNGQLLIKERTPLGS